MPRKMMDEQGRIDQLWREFINDIHARLKHYQSGAKAIRLARTCSYRIARSWARMLRTNKERLVELIASAKEQSGMSLDDFIYKVAFRDAALYGEDPYQLLADVQKGMKLHHYLSGLPAVFRSDARLKREKQEARETAPLPPLAPPEAPLAEQLAAALEQARLARELHDADAKKIRKLEREIAELKAALRKLSNRAQQAEALITNAALTFERE